MQNTMSASAQSETFDLKEDARLIVEEVAFAVDHIELSKLLESSDNCMYLNLTTKEKNTYCVQLSIQGFRVVGRQYDKLCEGEFSNFFETIYAMLDSISPQYRESFGNALIAKLSEVQKNQEK